MAVIELWLTFFSRRFREGPERYGEVHPETAPMQAQCSALRSTEQSAFRGREKGAKVPRKDEKNGWPAKGQKVKKKVRTVLLQSIRCNEFSFRERGFCHEFLPITSFNGPLVGFKKSRSRGKDDKNKPKKGKDEKEDKTWKREKPPHLVWGFFWAIFTIKLGKN